MMIVDCGIGFPDLKCRESIWSFPIIRTLSKIDINLRGSLFPRGHEDHIGALPFLLRDIKTTIWAFLPSY